MIPLGFLFDRGFSFLPFLCTAFNSVGQGFPSHTCIMMVGV